MRTIVTALAPAAIIATLALATAGCGSSDTKSGSTASTTSGTASTGSGGASGGAGGTSGGTGGATTTSAGGAGGAATGAGGAGGWGSGSHEPVSCQGHIYLCGDGLDNDGDGKIDSDDPDCLGPCHNSESTFYGSIPGQSGPACEVDCYFDQDSGSGNDDCRWDHRCDPNATSPDFYPEHAEGSTCEYNANYKITPGQKSCTDANATQSQACLDFCGPLTPNGCDCFGCCELPAGGGKYVWLGSEDASGNGSCDLANMDDPTKCQPCQPVAACLNTCGHCELCLGKTTLPADCNPSTGAGGSGGATGSSSSTGSGGGGTQCPVGVQACGLTGQAACPSGQYCITGCCQSIIK